MGLRSMIRRSLPPVVTVAFLATLAGGCAGRAAELSAWNYSANVRAFGAFGDGRTDDTAALRSAVQWARTARAPVYLPPGQYLLRDKLRLNVPIRGEWSRSSVLLLAGPSSGLIVTQSEQVHIRDLSIEGDGSADQTGIQIGEAGQQADFVYLSGLEVRRCGGDGIRFAKGNCGTVRDCRLFDNRGYGLRLDGIDTPGCTNAHQIQAYLVANGLGGLCAANSSSNTIDVVAEGNGSANGANRQSGWGLEIDNNQRLITCYTEGNAAGGLWCKMGCYGAIINCWSWEGWKGNRGSKPLVENRNNQAIWGQTQRPPWEPAP